MISPANGEVAFHDGLVFKPEDRFMLQVVWGVKSQRNLPVAGWIKYDFGMHLSEHGAFTVEGVSDPQMRVRMVLLRHEHPFYQEDTPEDEERRAFHEGVIGADLSGQREFWWGEAVCRLDAECNQDWLVLTHQSGAGVPRPEAELLRSLHERARE